MKKTQRLFALVLALCLVLTCTMAFAATKIDKAKESTVRIVAFGTLNSTPTVYDGSGNAWKLAQQEVVFTGSAFAVGQPGKPVQYFITNKHCVTFEFPFINASTEEVAWIEYEPDVTEFYVVYDNISNALPARVTDTSSRADLALIEIEKPTDLRPAAVLASFERHRRYRQQGDVRLQHRCR